MAGIFFRRIFGQYRYYIVILLGAAVGSLMANLVIDDITDKIGMFNESIIFTQKRKKPSWLQNCI